MACKGLMFSDPISLTLIYLLIISCFGHTDRYIYIKKKDKKKKREINLQGYLWVFVNRAFCAHV